MTDVDRLALADCPIGLFMSEGGELCLKTEYGNNEGRIDAYIVSSGEFFWGGTSKPQDQRKVLVTPIDYDDFFQRLPAALYVALSHIEHMSAYIADRNRDPTRLGAYSFESLGEDSPDMRAVLSRVHNITKPEWKL